MYPSPSFNNYQHFAIFFIQPVHFWGKYFKAHPRYPVISSINFSISLIDDDLLDMTTVLLSHLTKLTIIPNTYTLPWFCFYSWFKLDGMPFKSLLSCNNSPWLFFLISFIEETESFVLSNLSLTCSVSPEFPIDGN